MHKKLTLAFTFFAVVFLAGKVSAQINSPSAPNNSMMGDYNQKFLEKLIDTAKKYYPETRIRALQTKTAMTSLGQQHASWFNGVSIAPSYVYNPSAAVTTNANGSTTSFLPGYQVAFNINITSFFTHGYDVTKAKQAVKIAELNEDEYKLTLTGQVSRYYVAYIGAQANLRNAKRAVDQAQINLEIIKHKYEAAETTFTEYYGLITALSTQNTAEVTAEMAVLTAKVNLEEFVGKRLEDIK